MIIRTKDMLGDWLMTLSMGIRCHWQDVMNVYQASPGPIQIIENTHILLKKKSTTCYISGSRDLSLDSFLCWIFNSFI